MAFIRSYSRSTSLRPVLEMGDPFSFRIPKKLRKWQPGKSLAKVARAVAPVASFLPGVGGIVGRLAQLSQRYSVPIETLQGFARAYGYDVGDPGGAPKKRKSAATGTKAKAKAKQTRRAEKATKPKTKARRPSGTKSGVDWAKIGEAATSLLPIGSDLAKEIYNQARGAGAGEPDLGGALGELGAGLPGGKHFRIPGMGGHRRSMNPANVKALRRSIRRVEGFENLVKRVEKAFPRLKRAHKSAGGCGCAKKRGR